MALTKEEQRAQNERRRALRAALALATTQQDQAQLDVLAAVRRMANTSRYVPLDLLTARTALLAADDALQGARVALRDEARAMVARLDARIRDMGTR